MAVAGGFPGPLFVVTLAMLTGGGVWYAFPSHQALVHDEFAAMSIKIHNLEEKLMSKAAGVRQLLKKYDKDGSGTISPEELLQANADDPVEAMLGPFWTKSSVIAVVLANTSLVLVLALAAFFYFRGKAGALPSPIGVLELKIVKGTDLVNVDAESGIVGDCSDPYVEAYVGGAKHTTTTIKDNLNPEWKEKHDQHLMVFSVDLKDAKKNKLSLLVFDGKDHAKLTDMLKKPKALGHVEVNIAEVFGPWHHQEVTKYVPLTIDIPHSTNRAHDTHEQHGHLTITGVFKPNLPKPSIKAQATRKTNAPSTTHVGCFQQVCGNRKK